MFIAFKSDFSRSSLDASDRQYPAPVPSPSLQQRYRQHQMAMRGTTPNLPLAVSECDQVKDINLWSILILMAIHFL